MKNKFFYSTIIILIILFYTKFTQAQSWNLFGGNVITTTEFLGGTAASTIPLNIRMDAAQPINFLTGGAQHMTILGDGSGCVGIGQTPYVNSGVGTLLTIGDGTTAQGWQPWMVHGTRYVQGTDEMYVGMRQISTNGAGTGTDRNDAIISWGDNLRRSADKGPDNLRFIFNELPSESGDDTAQSLDGLEAMRFMPIDSEHVFMSLNAGIGNYSENYPIPPMRRLEVLDGMHGQFTGGVYGYVHVNHPQLRLTYTQDADVNLGIHVDFQEEKNGNLLINPQNGTLHRNVGIGLSTANLPLATLDVLRNQPQGSPNRAFRAIGDLGLAIGQNIAGEFLAEGHSNDWGIRTQSLGNGNFNYGIQGLAQGATGINATNFGGYFQAGPTPPFAPIRNNIGVYGSILEPPPVAGNYILTNYAVYGDAGGPHGFGQNSWAGYFNGFVFSTQLYQTSDSILKQDVQTFTGDSALQIIRLLKPRTFKFDSAGFPSMVLPVGHQYGLIAQEVGRVMPGLVTHTVHPEYADSSIVVSGDTITTTIDSVRFLSLNYTGLIPILVAGEKQLDSLQNALPNRLNNALTTDTTTHMLQWGGSPLKHNTEIPMVDGLGNPYNIFYSGEAASGSSNKACIGIGHPTTDALQGKIDVVNQTGSGYNSPLSAGYFYTTGTGYTYSYPALSAVTGINDATGGGYGAGILKAGGYFLASNAPGQEFGVIANASNSESEDIGVYTNANNSWGNAVTIGVLANASNYSEEGSYNTGIMTSAAGYGEGESWNVGVQATVPNDPYAGNIAIYGIVSGGGSTSPCYAGFFDGDVYTTGSYLPSDFKLKTGIKSIGSDSAMDIIRSLSPKTYTYNQNAFPTLSLPSGRQYGLVADDVQQILPSLVKNSIHLATKDSMGRPTGENTSFKALNYTGFIPLLIAATKQLDSTNQAQQTKIDSLQSQLAQISTALQQLQNCCQQSLGGNQPNNREEVVLSNGNAIILDQNAPNPFAEQTTINYTIPESVGNSQIIFSDINGQVIKTLQITTRGVGSLLVYASNLSSGIYTYSLIADGKLIDTKKMTIQK